MSGTKIQRNSLLQPYLKWAGGKRQLLPEIRKYRPQNFNTYYEPFVGAGAVLFDLQPKNSIINDVNSELVNTYKVLKSKQGLEELLQLLQHHKENNSKEYFYQVRDEDRDESYKNKSEIEKAARLIYLNKTCFNGLFRVNSQGQFNVPFGNYKNPQIVNEIVLRAVHNYLNSAEVEILNQDFQEVLSTAEKGDFIYLDPPYDPVSSTSSFTGYSLDGFNREDQIRLRDTFVELDKRGCKVLLSNSATGFIKEIYGSYKIEIVSAKRNINSVASKRGKIDEVLVMNYGQE
ncbi:DNA adenine methylase [Oceanobacillus profundus]|uniref:DNA adenine methylase n=1 Tax=Oceanobacillus profundus TaxID=372463 RepID=UPI00203ACB08|nr:DNA adenine methylase [Oceanobacillus profundus]MCM3398210.1 DNA adenine methylase [Oceanobacillus profundus]